MTPDDWDEAGYLQANPNVGYAISIGNFLNGYHHYIVAGTAEGRIGGFAPTGWNETDYLTHNPSTRVRLALGDYHNGYLHYAGVGRAQGLMGGFAPTTLLQYFRFHWSTVNKALFQAGEMSAMAFSTSALKYAVLTIANQDRPPAFNAFGMRVWKGQDANLLKAGGSGSVFRTQLLAGKWDLWLDQPRRMFCFTNDETGMTTFDPYRFMLRRAYAAKLDMRLYTTPLHAAVRQLLIDLGLGSRYEYWLKALANINEEEAARAGQTPFPLWDFSLPNEITKEKIPPMGDLTPMHGYWEFSHYRSAVGDLILDRIFDHHDPARALPDDFGVRLRAATIDQHIARSNTAIAAWDDTELKATIAYITQMPVVLNNQAKATCW